MKDYTGRDLEVGQFVLYARSWGRSDATLYFGLIEKINDATGKIWLLDTDQNKRPKYTKAYNPETRQYEETDKEAVSIVNHTGAQRFYIMP